MATRLQIKTKIKTAANVAKITRAMEMVAASKMKRAQTQAQAGRPYSEGILELVKTVTAGMPEVSHPLLTVNNSGREAILIIAPEKSLCGSLVSNLERAVYLNRKGHLHETDFIGIGKKAGDAVRHLRGKMLADFPLGFAQPEFSLVIPVASYLKDLYFQNQLKSITAVFPKFVSTLVYEPTFLKLLPFDFTGQNEADTPKTAVTYEPSAESISRTLLDSYLETIIYQLVLESFASEQSARMISMKNATDNAQSIVSDLTTAYNKARQLAITSEIIDIATASSLVN